MFKSPISFSGRIRRTEYAISALGYFLIYYFVWGMDEGRGGDFLAILLVIPTLWFVLAQGAKRCHDIGKSGWLQMIPFYILWLIWKRGYAGVNQYGADPKVVPYADNEEDNYDLGTPSRTGF